LEDFSSASASGEQSTVNTARQDAMASAKADAANQTGPFAQPLSA
jgi:hypothetical protein